MPAHRDPSKEQQNNAIPTDIKEQSNKRVKLAPRQGYIINFTNGKEKLLNPNSKIRIYLIYNDFFLTWIYLISQFVSDSIISWKVE